MHKASCKADASVHERLNLLFVFFQTAFVDLSCQGQVHYSVLFILKKKILTIAETTINFIENIEKNTSQYQDFFFISSTV